MRFVLSTTYMKMKTIMLNMIPMLIFSMKREKASEVMMTMGKKEISFFQIT